MEEADKLKKITAVLLENEIDSVKLTNAIKDYETMLTSLSGVNMQSDEAHNNIYFENGSALGTTWAATCINDLKRTKLFIKGLYEAVKYLKQGTNKPVHILYAGSGPFATLVLPLFTCFAAAELQVTILEINPLSFGAVKRIIDKLGFNDYIKSFENTDATKYKVNKADYIDIVLSETMQHGLVKEQQVSIMVNLLSQLPENVMIIPIKTELYLGLLKSVKNAGVISDNHQDNFKKVASVFELSKKSIPDLLMKGSPGTLIFPEVCIELPSELTAGYDHLIILTEIHIFGNEKLAVNESGLTIPLILDNIENIRDKKITVKLQYEIGAEPGLHHSISQK